MKSIVFRGKQGRNRRGLALIPVLAIVVIVSLLTGLLAKRQVRDHRMFETARRQAMALQLARGEAGRIRSLITAKKPVEPGTRRVTGAEVPGLPEPAEVRVESPGGGTYRIEVVVPAGASATGVRERIEIP